MNRVSNLESQVLLVVPLPLHTRALSVGRKTPWFSWTSGASNARPADKHSLQNARSLQFLQLQKKTNKQTKREIQTYWIYVIVESPFLSQKRRSPGFALKWGTYSLQAQTVSLISRRYNSPNEKKGQSLSLCRALWRILRAKMYFSSLKWTNEKWESNNRTM